MAVLLRTSWTLPRPQSYHAWASLDAPPPGVDATRQRPAVAAALEAAFDASADTWLELGRRLSADATAGLAHAPACVANASDLGLMLAWSRLVSDWEGESQTTLLICDDPWLFRHLRRRVRVVDGRPPGLLMPTLKLKLRGLAARLKVALTVAVYALALRGQRRRQRPRPTALLVYGHPGSTADGHDAYFGDLMRRFPDLVRMLHVDCPAGPARRLAADARTFSLHGWGNALAAIGLPFRRWRPRAAFLTGDDGWLIRRAAALEAGTGQAAMIAWQIHCQDRWLAAVRPRIVAWPWENHSWERTFVGQARSRGVVTVGYQHSVIGPQMLNYSPRSNRDGLAGIPDHVACSGTATRDQLAAWGLPRERMVVAGALRFPTSTKVGYDGAAPVFVALPFDATVSAEMVAAVRAAADGTGKRFLVKPHPMNPFAFDDSPTVARTDQSLERQASLSAVVYAASTVGLEALLMGLPTLRFRPSRRVAIDILPTEVNVPVTDAASLAGDLANLVRPASLSRRHFFAPVDMTTWKRFVDQGDIRHAE